MKFAMDTQLLDQFDRELEVDYRGEVYRVRDNGAVCRQRKPDQRKRPLDDAWTFGRPNASTGYMYVGSEVVHRIVATAFHGEQPSEKHIVDHIDTNRRNNRVENLHWITRLDNLLLNPITRRKIISAYGSLDEFFKNPGAATEPGSIRNFEWMRTVSKEEAQESLDRLRKWADSGQIPNGGRLGDWVYGVQQPNEPVLEGIPDKQSLTPMAMQRNWKTPSKFPMCPDSIGSEPLGEYVNRLEFGTVLSRTSFGEAMTIVAEQGDELLSVLCRLVGDPSKEWALTKVTVENGKFVHENVSTFFSLQGAMKEHCKLADVPFNESIDDYS
jgi:hypothetical protein